MTQTYTRLCLGFLAAMLLLPQAGFAATDEFGSRFTGRAPDALQEPSLEQKLQEIAPAAGPDDGALDTKDGTLQEAPQDTPEHMPTPDTQQKDPAKTPDVTDL